MGWQLRHTNHACNRTCKWSKCDSRHVVYCLSGGRKGHAEVLIKSVVTAVMQRCQILWHTLELREWCQPCWKSCTWAFNRQFAAWCGDLVSPGRPAWAFQVSQNQCSCRELCWGLLLQADSGAQGGDEQDRILVELLGAGCCSAPTRGTGEWTWAWHRQR